MAKRYTKKDIAVMLKNGFGEINAILDRINKQRNTRDSTLKKINDRLDNK